ncbi:MAG: DUF1015 domain-containing protein [Lachnospiraceae bacterium]|nr:DUF1015 domain-containing protein [Lachnospiraceae bacterium]
MALVKPFKAVRPKKGLEDKIAALPYDVYSSMEAREVVADKPDSFLNIDRPETMFEVGHDMYAKEVYLKAAERFNEMISDGRFVQEDSDCFYIYELIMDGRSQTGIVGCSSVDDYNNSVIKKHENTRADKELDRINHVDALSAQTGPIFLAYRADEKLSALVNSIKGGAPLYDFTSEDGITHRAWVISDEADIKLISERFEAVGDVYIADGHHRCASAAKVCIKRREENPGYTGDEEFNSFLSVLFPDEELMIMDYNRVLKDLNGMSAEEVISKLSELGEVTENMDEDKHPKKKGVVSFFIDDKWYTLAFKDELMLDDPVEGLDVSVLQNNVLKPLFGIDDPKTDKRIDFVGGIRGIKELEKRVNTDCKIAFAMYPTDISELFSVADAGLLMPPKSTWFEPKLRSGLFIHKF